MNKGRGMALSQMGRKSGFGKGRQTEKNDSCAMCTYKEQNHYKLQMYLKNKN